MGAEVGNRIVKELRAPGRTRTLVAAVRVRRLRLWTTSAFLSVGPAGLEPAPAWLKAGDAAANTLVPSPPAQSARRELNPRLGAYKAPALTAELRARASRAGGNRTHTLRIKSPLCCLLHHDPGIDRVYLFPSVPLQHHALFCV